MNPTINSKSFMDTYLIQFFYSFAQLLSASLLFLNAGRVFGGMAAILSLLSFGISEYALILGGAAMLLYPLVIHVKRLYRPMP